MSQTNSSTPTCPKCSKVIVNDDINVANDVAYCRSCSLVHRLSGFISQAELVDGIDFNHPPAGVNFSDSGWGVVVTATHRSFVTALGTLAIALFWNGIVSVFVLLAIAGTLRNLNVPLPNGFPAPNMNGSPMSLGMTVFLWIFLTPFIVIGLSMIGAFIMSIGGRTEFRKDHNTGTIFTGIGPLGYRRSFEASKVSGVRIDDRRWRDSDGDRNRKICICIETHEGKIICFGSQLSEERRKFMAASVHKALME